MGWEAPLTKINWQRLRAFFATNRVRVWVRVRVGVGLRVRVKVKG